MVDILELTTFNLSAWITRIVWDDKGNFIKVVKIYNYMIYMNY